jgi:hypothetical protein
LPIEHHYLVVNIPIFYPAYLKFQSSPSETKCSKVLQSFPQTLLVLLRLGKGKVTLVGKNHAMKNYQGVEVKLNTSLTLALGGERGRSTPVTQSGCGGEVKNPFPFLKLDPSYPVTLVTELSWLIFYD